MNYKILFTFAQDKGYIISFGDTVSDTGIINVNDYLWGDCEESKKTHSYQELLTLSYLEMCLIQKWLRDKHNIGVAASQFPVYNGKYGYQYGKTSISSGWTPCFEEGETYEKALSKGIYEALKLLK